MALPVTITGLSTAVGIVGPFKATNGNYYFFGRDGTTATTLQAFKSTAPDTSWASIATKTGFTTAILKLDAYQVGNVIHLLVQDGTASTAQAVKYVSFNAATDTFLATTETVAAAVAVTGQATGNWGASLVVRSSGEVVAFYNGLQTKASGTFRARNYYRRRTGVNTWSTETTVDGGTGAVDNIYPLAVLGSSDRVHFIYQAGSGTLNVRTLSVANALSTSGTGGDIRAPSDAVSYDRAGTIKVVITSNLAGSQTTARFNSTSDSGPVVSVADQGIAAATIPHRIGVDISTDEVTIAYLSSADGDLYAIKSTDDGATFGSPVSLFVGTVASADANLSRSSTGSMYQRGSNFVVGYVVNDNGTLKYNEYTIRSVGGVNYADTIEPSALPIAGADITGVYVARVNYADTIEPSALPIIGATLAPVYTINYIDTLTASALPISGATLTADVFASRDTITPSAVPVGGAVLADLFVRSDTIAPSSVPLVGATLADLLAYSDAISPSGLPITGQAIAPVYTVRYADTLTASSLPIGGQAITPVYSAGGINYADTIAPSALPLVGSTIAPVYSADGTVLNRADNIYVGSALAAKVYLGTVQVWPPASEPVYSAMQFSAIFTALQVHRQTVGPHV